jgi:predicted PurR-regulated permease PerM
MESTQLNLSKHTKLAMILVSLGIIILLLYFGQHILIPILLALLFAILLRPVVVFLNTRLRFPHVIAVLTAISLSVIIIGAIIFFISWQVSDITDDWKKIRHNLSVHYEHVQHWIRQRYHLSYHKQQNYINQITGDTMNGGNELMGNTLSSFTDILINALLIPIYTFLILLYRTLFLKFLYKVVSEKNKAVLSDILAEVKTVVRSYIIGLFIEMGIVCALTTGGLMLLGVEYALFLGVITALLNLVPYIGILVAAIVTLLATLVNSAEISVMLGVVVLCIVVQFIDNNILVPKIVGNKVRINALVSMVGILIGGAIAGIAGMFLALPVIAILKVIFDRIEPLAPWGFLLGDDLLKPCKWHKIKLPDLSVGSTTDTWQPQNTNTT